MSQSINCPKGCPPATKGIGTNGKVVVWIYTQGNGSITNVTGLPDPPFSGGRQNGATYQVDYAGTSSTPESWTYKLTSSPACPTSATEGEIVEEDPQLTNDPG